MAKEGQDFKTRRGLSWELTSLPVLNYFSNIYETIKSKHVVFETSLDVVEKGCCAVGVRLLGVVSNPDELESKALNYLKYMKESYPIIKKTPKGIYRKTKSKIVDWGLKKTQVVLQTTPGKVAVWSVGAASNVSDKLLSAVHYVTRTQQNKAPPSKNNEIPGAYPGNSVVTKGPNKKKRRNSIGESTYALVEYTVVIPIELTAKFLQTLHLWFHILLADAEKTKSEKGLSPQKAAEIKNRRKVSPKKRPCRSAVKSWGKTVLQFLRIERLLPFFSSKSFVKNIDPSLKDVSPNKSDDCENKRKYDDIASDSSSGPEEPSYIDQLRRLDLSQYMSDEDPDFQPGFESTDSEEFAEDETESDEDLSIANTPNPLSPRKKSTPMSVPANLPGKAAEKAEKKIDTPKKSILKQPNQTKENENSKVRQKVANDKVKLEEGKDYVQLTFKATKLDSKDIIGKSDPYLTLMRQGTDGKWLVLHKTEIITNSSEPSWKSFSVPLLSLWNGDKSKQIKITVYDKDDTGSDDFVGEAIVTIEDILKASKQEVSWNIINQKKQSKKKNYIHSGQVHLVSCKGILEDLKEK